jgi:hypothetical protein
MPAVESYERLVREVPSPSARVGGAVADRHFPAVEPMGGWIDQPSLVPFREHLDVVTGELFRAAVVARMTRRTCEGGWSLLRDVSLDQCARTKAIRQGWIRIILFCGTISLLLSRSFEPQKASMRQRLTRMVGEHPSEIVV